MQANSEKQNGLTSPPTSQCLYLQRHRLSALICICMWRQRCKNVLLRKMGGGEKGERRFQERRLRECQRQETRGEAREGEEGIGNIEKSRAGKSHPLEAQEEQEGRKKEKTGEMEKANIEGANMKSVSCLKKKKKKQDSQK